MTVHWHDDEVGFCPCDESNGEDVTFIASAWPTVGAPFYAAAYAVGGDRTEPDITEVAVPRKRSLPAAPPAVRRRANA